MKPPHVIMGVFAFLAGSLSTCAVCDDLCPCLLEEGTYELVESDVGAIEITTIELDVDVMTIDYIADGESYRAFFSLSYRDLPGTD